MGKVVAQAIMSLDGYVAKQDNTIGLLFDWLENGEVEIPTPAGDFAVHLTPASAKHWRHRVSSAGALVCGRTLFDVADGWQGRHTLDVPVVVLTHRVPTHWVDAHPEAPFTFVTDGVAAAVAHAQTLAGDRVVAVTGGTIATQCLNPGLLDEVFVDLVPVVMGGQPTILWRALYWEEKKVIVTIARVTDPDRFLEVFETIGAVKRREHGCRGARVYVDPDDAHRMWSIFDWDAEDYDKFLADPEIPAIARELGLQAPPVHPVAATELDA